MPVIASGIGSGLDVGGIVESLVAAEAEPVNTRLNAREVELDSELSALGTLKSALATFQGNVERLEDGTTFQVFNANSTNEDTFTATANDTAVAGSYSIEVVQLAQSEKLRTIDFTDSNEVVGTGTLDITLGATTFQITIDSAASTLGDIRNAINSAEDNPGVSASLINVDSGTQLILTSDEVGSANTISIAAVDDNGADGADLTRLNTANLISLQTASDAIINVDSQTVTRTSNSFSDVISGVTFNLASAQPGTTETLSVVLDDESIIEDVEGFVSNYNTLVGVMRGLSNFDQSTLVAGPLNGDSVIRGIQTNLREALSSTVSGGSFSTLTELGISIDSTGNLSLDETVMNENLASNLIDVKQFFSSEGGIAQAFNTAISGYVDNDGIIDSRSDGLQDRLNDIDDRRDNLDRRMEALQARLTAQFTAMDTLVAQLQSTGTFLTQQLANLPQISNN